MKICENLVELLNQILYCIIITTVLRILKGSKINGAVKVSNEPHIMLLDSKVVKRMVYLGVIVSLFEQFRLIR